MQLPVSNHLDLLTPGAAGWGAKRQSLQLQERAAPSRDHGERGGVLAFLCENSSRKVGAAAPGALHQNRGPCALVPWAAAWTGQKTPVSRASCCRNLVKQIQTSCHRAIHQKKTRPTLESRISCVSVQPLIMLATFTCRRKD